MRRSRGGRLAWNARLAGAADAAWGAATAGVAISVLVSRKGVRDGGRRGLLSTRLSRLSRRQLSLDLARAFSATQTLEMVSVHELQSMPSPALCSCPPPP